MFAISEVPSAHSAAGYRLYVERDRQRLQQIRFFKDLRYKQPVGNIQRNPALLPFAGQHSVDEAYVGRAHRDA